MIFLLGTYRLPLILVAIGELTFRDNTYTACVPGCWHVIGCNGNRRT